MSNVQGHGPFTYDSTVAEAHGLSVAVGRLFATAYRNNKDQEMVLDLLEAYKSLRRSLPREFNMPQERIEFRHIGAEAAHKATQGQSRWSERSF